MAKEVKKFYQNDEEKAELLRQGNVSLILDSYDDLFSDFDPRPTPERGISEDFLEECERAVRDRDETNELRLLIPKNKRNFNEETLIKKRMKEHFTKHYNEKKKEISNMKRKGALLIFIGIVLMFISYLVYSDLITAGEIVKNILLIITEPAGWFFFWIGGEKFVYQVNEINPKYKFYKKMSSAKISFHNY